MPKVAILLSGRGSNMAAILDSAHSDAWRAHFVVIANRADAPGLRLAEERGVSTRVVASAGLDREAYDELLTDALIDEGPAWIALAGFMRLLGPKILRTFPGTILNVHPSLLPALPGLHTHRRALEGGLREHGCTVHLVELAMDSGPILAQARVPVLPGDDEERLAARVLEQEHHLYPAVLRSAILGRLAQDYPSRVQEASS